MVAAMLHRREQLRQQMEDDRKELASLTGNLRTILNLGSSSSDAPKAIPDPEVGYWLVAPSGGNDVRAWRVADLQPKGLPE